MKRLILLLLVIFVTSCKRDIGVVSFSLHYSAEMVVPSAIGINTPLFTAPSPDIVTNSNQEFRNNGTDLSHVQEVKLTNLVISVKNPPEKSLNFLKSIHLYLSSEGLPEIEIGYNDDVPANLTTLHLTTNNLDLAPYIKAEKFKLRSKVVTDEALLQDYTLKADMELGIKASTL